MYRAGSERGMGVACSVNLVIICRPDWVPIALLPAHSRADLEVGQGTWDLGV